MGFPANGSGKVHSLASLTPESRREIERRIFGPLPTNEQLYYNEYRDRLTVTFDIQPLVYTEEQGAYDDSDEEDNFHPRDIEPVNLNQDAVRLPADSETPRVHLIWRDFQVLFNSRPLPGTVATQSDGDKRYMRPTTKLKLVEQYITLRTQKQEKGETKIFSCKMLNLKRYYEIDADVNEGNRDAINTIKTNLNAIKVTPENFMTLDFLFIPFLEGGHYRLFGFAPKQREVFVVDSSSMDKNNQYDGFMYDSMNRNDLLAILLYLVPNPADREQWDLNFDFVLKDDKENSQAIGQRDTYNCGIYVCTNALLLAFGYNLKSFGARDIDQFRKKRMVAEFRNGGFSGLYNYDLIELPPPREPTGPSESYRKVLELQELEAVSEGPDSEALGAESSTENEDDLNEARGLENTVTVESIAINDTIKLSTKTIFPTASQCLARDLAAGAIRPESIDRPTNPRYTSANQRFGFLYDFSHIDFNEAVKCSKEEMIQACKSFPVANWEKWSSHPKDFFLKWMMTEMGATMSRIHKDPIQPCSGLGDGYNIWLEWNSEDGEVKVGTEPSNEISEQTKKNIDAGEKTQTISELRKAPQASLRAARMKRTTKDAVITDALETKDPAEPKRKRRKNIKTRNYGLASEKV
ncbi:hypothetical protein BDZ45DRAFT_749328 [Acephala macrosclerotiorum]|nr:hypothetical protein BDZ45DRAFT_749328 [Acephala macrosclerotiorum]